MAALRWGGSAVYGVIAYAVIQGPYHGQPSPLDGPPVLTVTWILLMVAVVLCYWQATELQLRSRIRRVWAFGMVVLNISLMALLPSNSDQNLLLILSSAVLPSVLSWPQVVSVIIVQALWILIVEMWGSIGWSTALLNTLLWLVLQLALALLVRFTTDGRRALRTLAERNVQLRTTQALLEHASREAERMRIARDLHDMLGHHLTVLSINLELAELSLDTPEGSTVQKSADRSAEPDASLTHLTSTREALERARCAQRRLMADVRGAVEVLRIRQPGLVVFAEELQRSVPQLKVHVTLPETPPVHLERVEAILMRFMQESLTNTLRHAQAQHLWLEICTVPGGVRVHAHDDGRIHRSFKLGVGLTGLQERFEHAGGSLSVCGQGRSLRLDGFVPTVGG